ncbi:MAG: DEAD/DEAH box helicase [Clostridiales bacterium]|nr:DEAD/DEAH box helicase [Clostridiales bacterium]
MKKLTDIKGVGESTAKKLELLGVEDIPALLNFEPSRYVDLGFCGGVLDFDSGEYGLIKGEIAKVSDPNFKRKYFSLTVKSVKGSFIVYFFNMMMLKNKFSVGESFVFYGKINSDDKGVRYLINPDFEPCDKIKHLKGVAPVYPLKGILSQKVFKNIILNALNSDIELRPRFFSDEFCKKHDIKTYKETLFNLHMPSSVDEGLKAKERLKIEQTARQIAAFEVINSGLAREKKYSFTDDELNRFCSAFEFELTLSQKEAAYDIACDLKSSRYMNRLICGDVGSGKTACALIAAALALNSGYQAALLAPTSILAEQHDIIAKEYLGKLGFSCRLITSETENKYEIVNELNSGTPALYIGTHALLLDNINPQNLSLVIIDEQQRFGVAQKGRLIKLCGGADALSLSATPIPRTVALSGLGFISLSNLKPIGNGRNVSTHLVPHSKVNDMLNYIAEEIKRGKKAYIICPRLYDSEGVELYSVEKLSKELKKGAFKDIGFAIMHGKMSDEDKNKALKKFKDGQVKAVVSTSVVEVGIDVQDASIMAVLSADRFGLSTLHQLRGRVGRNGETAWCYLCLSENAGENSIKRLGILKQSYDGAEIAQKDFEMRGSGELFGQKQSGTEGFGLTDEVIKKAEKLAKLYIEEHKPNADEFEDLTVIYHTYML